MQTLEPVTIADARAFLSLNMTDTAEDALLDMLISGARAEAETYLRRRIAQQEVRLVYSARPMIELPDVPVFIQQVILRRGANAQDITTGSKLVDDSTLQVPLASRDGSVEVVYVCQEYCPPQVKNALLMMVRNAYTDRSADPMTDDVKRILAPHRRLLI